MGSLGGPHAVGTKANKWTQRAEAAQPAATTTEDTEAGPAGSALGHSSNDPLRGTVCVATEAKRHVLSL